MNDRKNLLDKALLYLILDTQVNDPDSLLSIAEKAILGGVDVIQLRDKNGMTRETLKIAQRLRKKIPHRILFIMNDRVDLALASGCDGVHLGQEDLPCEMARKILGPDRLIGISCQTLKMMARAQRSGADYIGFGSVFKTLTKPHRHPMDLRILKSVVEKTTIPLFAIGGITASNISLVKKAGIQRVATCRDICLAKDVKGSACLLKQALKIF